MKKTLKKVMSVALATTLAFGLTACGDTATSASTSTEASVSTETSTSTEASVEPAAPAVDKITVMMDGTVFTEPNGRAEFEKALEDLMGVDLVFIQPDHSGYYDQVSQTFANPDTTTWPDVVLLGSTYYATYANNGVLADISDYWENSEILKSGRVKNPGVIDGIYIGDALYGITPASGNGCITYVKKAWMDKAGLTEAPKNYEEYCKMLQAFVDTYGTYAVTSAGIVNNEAPYVNYLPEFFQDAYPDFYENADGKWVDGFTEQAMRDALDRLVEAYDKGWLDPECVTNKTSDCRDKFYADKCGVFTYWAGTWAYNLKSKLEAASVDSELIAMEPIAEVGKYIERQAVVWGITSACKNPEEVFNKFFGTMLDGDKGQMLWQYGVEGVHWSMAAETVSYTSGDKTVENTYEEGTFHYLVNLESKDALYKKNHIDRMLAITTMKGDDPGAMAVTPEETNSSNIFNTHSKLAPVITSNEVMNQYQSEIMALRVQLVSEVVTDGLSVDDAFARYNDEVGSKVTEILDSLNK